MTVSIIMCTYNREKFLARAIDSILAQTYADWELIIVDDGSTDNTEELVESYMDSRIRYFKMDKNRFYCYAANFGLKECHGDYIAFQNSDDEWMPDKLEKQIEYLKNHPETGACFSAVTLIDDEGNDISEECRDMVNLFANCCSDRRNWMHLFFYYGNSLCHPSAVIRKDVMERVGEFNLLYCQLADFDLWIRIATEYPIYVLPERLIRFRWDIKKHDQVSSVTESHSTRTFNEQLMIRSQLIERLDDGQLLEYFQSDFQKADSKTHLELEFERAFLLMRCVAEDSEFKLLGLNKIEELLREEGAVEVLENHFGYTLQELYEWNQRHWYNDYILKGEREAQDQRIRALEQEIKNLYTIKMNLQKIIDEYRHSRSWKLTAPMRKAGRAVRAGRKK